MFAPQVSIVMPTLNQARFIREAIDSVLAQDYRALELIVVDGQSTDGTLDILRSYGDRLAWRSEKDRNLAEAINKGIRASHGDYIHSLASDEVLLPGAITTLVRHAETTGADIIIGQGFTINESSTVVGEIDVPSPYRFEDVLTLRLKLPFAFSFFRRSVWERYPFDEEFVVCTDFMFWLTVLERLKVAFIPDRIGCWRHQGEAWSVRPDAVSKIFEARMKAFDKYFKANPTRQSLYSRCYVGACCDVMENNFTRHAYNIAIQVFLASLCRYPFTTLGYPWMRSLARASLVRLIFGRPPSRLNSSKLQLPNHK